MAIKVFIVLILFAFSYVNCYGSNALNEAIDSSFLENALDAQECHRQIRAIRRNSLLLLQFTDAGLRTPRGALTGNAVDLGNYHQCLGIDHQLEDMHIEGKYCSILTPFDQTFELPRPLDFHSTQFDPRSLRLDNGTIRAIQEYNLRRRDILALSGEFGEFSERSIPGNPLASTVFRLGVCLPKPCTVEQAITSFFFNVSAIGFQFTEDYCRLPGDKTWAAADYVTVVVLSLLGLLTFVSTAYDLSYQFLLKKDVKQINNLYRSFSVYTNGQRLTTFSPGASSLECLNGIRTLAMLWVIIGHAFSTEPFLANPIDSFVWMFSASALWITAATMTVDTFFTLAGVLLVYTTAGKMNQTKLVKNLHWFYLSRFMRVTPMLAITILLQASFFNRVYDGPYWVTVAFHTQRCRDYWWSTLLHVQNFVHPRIMCVTHSWYVAIDFQLYLVSPLVLYWVLTGKKKLAWTGLVGGFLAILIASTIYSFHLNMQAGSIQPNHPGLLMDYFQYYYFNTLTRASPFFVGLIFGYLLHLYRKKKIRIPWILVIFLWACSAGILGGIFYFKYRIKQFDWDNQLIDNLMNSFMRPLYACALCWLIVACVHGYGGPINWFLSLEVWRLPARLTYGMYLFHYPLMYTLNATAVVPVYFAVDRFVFKFMSYLVLSVIYSFIFTVVVDSPVTILFKKLMDAGNKKKPPSKPNGTLKDVDESGMSNGGHTNVNAVHINPSDNTLIYKSNSDEVIAAGTSKEVHVDPNDVNTNSNKMQSDPKDNINIEIKSS